MTQTYFISVNLSKHDKYLNLNMKNLTNWLNAYEISSHLIDFSSMEGWLVWDVIKHSVHRSIDPPQKRHPLFLSKPPFLGNLLLYISSLSLPTPEVQIFQWKFGRRFKLLAERRYTICYALLRPIFLRTWS